MADSSITKSVILNNFSGQRTNMSIPTIAEQKIREVTQELRRAGLWKTQMPEWVTKYNGQQTASEHDFIEWLQFIYLPNCTSGSVTKQKTLIVPQALRFFGEDVTKGKLLQLLVELDAVL